MSAAERLDGRVCVVTGGAQGIGYAIAARLAACGGTLAILDLNGERARAAALRLEGSAHAGFAADVSDEAAVRDAFAAIAGLGPPSVLINAAGIMTPRLLKAAAMPVADFDRMMDIHVRGAFLCSRAALPAMEAAGFGRIVNITSVLGLMGLPFRIGYATAKTAVIGLTRSLAVEGGRHGITVNAIAPGYILTETLRARLDAGMLDYGIYAERSPVGRWGLPDEIARVATFLAAPASAFITGTVIPVDGGYTIRGDPNEDIGPRQPGIPAA